MWLGANNRAYTLPPPPPGVGVRLRMGHYVWFDNFQWPNSNQQAGFNAHIAELVANTNIKGVCIYMPLSALTGAIGDYSLGDTNIDALINTLNSKSRKLYLIIKSIVRNFNSTATSDTSYWPAAWSNKGWIINNGTNGTQVDWANAAMNSELINVWKHVAARYNGNRTVEAICPHDETDMVTDTAGTPSGATYYAAMKNLFLSIKPSCPNLMVWISSNFLPSTGGVTNTQRFDDLYTACRQLAPGGFALGGGPDPGTTYANGTTGQEIRRGTIGTLGDMRGIVPYIAQVQEGQLQGQHTPGQIAASDIGTNPSGTWPTCNQATHFVWNYESDSFEKYKWADEVAVINQMPPPWPNPVPSEGVFDTAP